MKQLSSEQIKIWAEKIVQSDKEAYNTLFREFFSPLVYFATKYTQNHAVSHDIVQDIFVTVWMERQDIDPHRSLKSYLFKMVRNKALNYNRDHADKLVALEQVNLSIIESFQMPAENENTSRLTEKFREWINELPDRRREAFELSRYDGLDHDEIAEVMNLSVKTVNNHIVAALSHLRDCYKRYNEKLM